MDTITQLSDAWSRTTLVCMEIAKLTVCQIGRSKVSLRKWGLSIEDTLCYWGEEQSISHMLWCILCPSTCTDEILMLAKGNVVDVAQYWANTI